MSADRLPRVCAWPECFRALRPNATYCDRHRAAVLCAAPGCRKRALADRTLCEAHRTGHNPAATAQPRRHVRQLAACTVCGTAPTVARSLCMRHYQRLRRTGSTADPVASDGACRYCAERATVGALCRVHSARLAAGDDLGPPRRINLGRVCADADCGRPAYHRGLCSAHYQRAYKAAKRARTLTADIGT